MNDLAGDNPAKLPVAVLGAGSWGTALALLLAQGGTIVNLWDRNPHLVDALAQERENKRYLPDFALPAPICPTSDLQQALHQAACVVVAVPSHAVREVLTEAAPFLGNSSDVVLAAKGMESTGKLPAEVAGEVIGEGHAIIALSGPNLAGEVARGVPTAAVAACPDLQASERVAHLFNRGAFRVYTSPDRTGVEIGGAVKNVLAIAGGVSDGLGFGDNTKATLLTRGLAEMTRFGVACGADARTFYGLAGVGDLMATAASRLSRNWRVGEGLAKGETLPHILERLGQVSEGVPTSRAVLHVAREKGVEMPVCEAVAALLFEGASPQESVERLLGRDRKGEWN